MLVGDKARFAVEFELDAEKARSPELGEWLFGTICFWCAGERVGLHDEETTLRDVLNEAKRILQGAPRRGDGDLLSAPKDEVLSRITDALFADSGQSDSQARADWERFSPFLVTPRVDVFDHWRIFLVEGGGRGRLIWSRRGDQAARERDLEEGEFDRVLQAFLAGLHRLQQDRLRPH